MERIWAVVLSEKFWIMLLSLTLLITVTVFSWRIGHEYTVDLELENLAKQAQRGITLNEPIRVKYLEQYVEVFRIVTVGVLATLASVLIPFVYSQQQAKFQRYKEARRAYSIAKTAVLYLGDRALDARPREAARPSDAFDLVERAHRDFHLAETFALDIRRQGFLDWYRNPEIWLLHNYWRIVAVAAALRWYEEPCDPSHDNAMPGALSGKEPVGKDLRAKIKETSTIVDRAFGELGENWREYEQAHARRIAEKVAKKTAEHWLGRWHLPSRTPDPFDDPLHPVIRQVKEACLRREIEAITIPGAALGLRLKDAGQHPDI